RHQPGTARGTHALEFAVQDGRILLHPCQPGLRILCRLDLVLALEKAGDVEIRADVLDDDVGRVAPATHGDVAVRQGETIECRAIRALHHVERRARLARVPCRVEAGRTVEVVAQRARDGLLPGRGAVRKLRTQCRAVTLVDAEQRRR